MVSKQRCSYRRIEIPELRQSAEIWSGALEAAGGPLLKNYYGMEIAEITFTECLKLL